MNAYTRILFICSKGKKIAESTVTIVIKSLRDDYICNDVFVGYPFIESLHYKTKVGENGRAFNDKR